MSSIIDKPLGRQGFEVIKEQIGAILATELENQKQLQDFNLPINVFLDRQNPFDNSENLMFNVGLRSYQKENKSQNSTHVTATYSIDVFVSTKQNNANRGDVISTNIRDRYIGLVDSILSSTKYFRLLYETPFLMGTMVTNVQTYEPQNEMDAKFVSMSRLTFEVRYSENYDNWDGMPFSSMFTDVRLDLTENGYKYELSS